MKMERDRTKKGCSGQDHAGPPDVQTREDPPVEVPEAACPYQHLDFGLLSSRTVRQEVPVVVSTPLVVLEHGSPVRLINLLKQSLVHPVLAYP